MKTVSYTHLDVYKRQEKEQETEEDRREEEAEIVTDTEMVQQAGDKEEARGGINWEKLKELMSRMEEQNKQTNEKIDSKMCIRDSG